MIKKYSEVIQLNTFRERYEYLKLRSDIGARTFGSDRNINQILYTSRLWRSVRDKVIIRDSGLDLAMFGHVITSNITIHHINPISVDDILNNSPRVYDLQNLICTSFDTHNAIHFGNDICEIKVVQRERNDTSPWLNIKKRG